MLRLTTPLARRLASKRVLTAALTYGELRDSLRVEDAINEDLLGEAYQRAAIRMTDELAARSGSIPATPSEGMKRRWRQILREEMEPGLRVMLDASDQPRFVAREIPVPGRGTKALEELIGTAVKGPLANTDDILNTLARAVRLGEDTPGFTVERLTAPGHTRQVARSLARAVSDEFEDVVVRRAVKAGKLTGARKWFTFGDPDSRHADLQGAEVGPGEDFHLHGKRFSHPRSNIQDANEWSGCTCGLRFQAPDGRWL